MSSAWSNCSGTSYPSSAIRMSSWRTDSKVSSPVAQPMRSLRGGWWWKTIATLRWLAGVRARRAQDRASSAIASGRPGTGIMRGTMAPVSSSTSSVSRVARNLVMRAPSSSGWAAWVAMSIDPMPWAVASHTARGA